VSPSLTPGQVAVSLAMYVIVYLVMFPTGIAVMAGFVRRGVIEESAAPAEGGQPTSPFAVPER